MWLDFIQCSSSLLDHSIARRSLSPAAKLVANHDMTDFLLLSSPPLPTWTYVTNRDRRRTCRPNLQPLPLVLCKGSLTMSLVLPPGKQYLPWLPWPICFPVLSTAPSCRVCSPVALQPGVNSPPAMTLLSAAFSSHCVLSLMLGCGEESLKKVRVFAMRTGLEPPLGLSRDRLRPARVKCRKPSAHPDYCCSSGDVPYWRGSAVRVPGNSQTVGNIHYPNSGHTSIISHTGYGFLSAPFDPNSNFLTLSPNPVD